MQTARALSDRFDIKRGDRFWNPLPLYHLSTLLPLAACCTAGATFIGVQHFEPGRALTEIEAHKATIIYPAFQTLMSSIVAHPDFKSTNFSSVRMMVNIGPHDLLRRFAQALPHVLQVSCYGLTESSGICCVTDLTDTPEDRIVTAGRPFHGSEIKIVNPDTLNDAEIGSLGEIWVRGDAVFCGYYKDPDLTAITITPDGWLRTGDLGELARGGRLIFKGRLKDMLKIGGENVAAAEIENFLMRHEGVKMAQVIPVADERLVEVAAAFVELMPGVLLTELDVADYCAERIASFKVPRYVKFVTDWPMGATKIAKHLLPRDFENRSALDVTEIIRRKRQAAQTARAGR